MDSILFVEAISTGESAVEKLQDLYLSSNRIIISNIARDAFIRLGLEHEDMDEAAEEWEEVRMANPSIWLFRSYALLDISCNPVDGRTD